MSVDPSGKSREKGGILDWAKSIRLRRPSSASQQPNSLEHDDKGRRPHRSGEIGGPGDLDEAVYGSGVYDQDGIL